MRVLANKPDLKNIGFKQHWALPLSEIKAGTRNDAISHCRVKWKITQGNALPKSTWN
jgi:hypothetical protein